ncbi:hypothetical protein CSUB01_09144 [Colletotrichum sublineola]|uniref:Uncharacterized protein n=1 Tax=Colletotrichum sublineola TaxID=1173701 RepID=A0A066XCM7_COLSU|nr:hypothetical protein CSUB01_09144 [Colletotrichum sublineola]
MARFTQGTKKRYFWSNEAVEDPTLHRTMSFPPPPPGWVLESVSAYDLKWYKLHQWLVDTFKDQGGKFEERQNMDSDNFLFYAPRLLTDAERTYIDNKLRETSKHDERRQANRDVHTPDP